MRCPSCQHDNDDSKKFCTSCGAALGGRRCTNGHTIPEGLTDCPFCPRPVRAATALDPSVGPAPAADGRRKATALVSPTELERSGVQVNAPSPAGARPAPAAAPAAVPAGRSKTVFRAPGDAAPPTAAPAAGAPPVTTASKAPLVGFLVSFSTDAGGQYWPIRFGRTSLGSDPTCEAVLTGTGISGRHAEVMVRDNRGTPKIWISDCNSTNGTQLNGADIFTDRPDLAHGDTISIAGVDITVVLLPNGQE